MTEEQDPSGAPAFGRSLRRTRERLGLSVDDIASELRLSRFQVRALEQDDWEQLPGTTYARGYLRSYARLLGLDADQLLSGATTQEIEITRTEPKIGAWKPGDVPAAATPARLPWGWVSALVLIGVLAMAYWQYREDGTLLPNMTRVETAAMTSEPESRSIPTGGAESGDRTAETTDAGLAEDTGASDDPVTPSAPQRVVFQFRQQSWVDVRDARGERLLYRSFQPGRRIEVEGHPPFSVFLGNARAVQVEYMGRTVAPHTRSGRLYARFVLGSPSG